MKNRVLSLIIGLLMSILVAVLALPQGRQKIHAETKHTGTLAVLNFDADPSLREMGVVISEIVRSEIASIPELPFLVVDRVMLDRIMKEQELAMSGVVDNAGAAKVGKVLFADHLVTGRVLVIGKEIRINARIIATNTAVVKKEATETVYSRDDLSGAAKAVAYRLFGRSYTYSKTTASAEKTPVEIPATGIPARGIAGSYTSIYSDSRGIHQGGKIHLTVAGDRVSGYTIEDIGRAEMTGTLSGDRIIGYYRGRYGYGNFNFRIIDGGAYLQGDYYQVSNGAHGDWLAAKGDTFVMPRAMFSGRWKEGSRCLVRWSGDSFWYPATVDAVKDGLYHVAYDDGDAEWRMENHIRGLGIKVGDVVFGNWLGKGRYYRGKIAEIKDRRIFIHYDDGDREWTSVARIRLMLE